MSAKTAGEALQYAFQTRPVDETKEQFWERLVQVARDWTPPPEPTLGDIAWRHIRDCECVTTCQLCRQAAGEACARLGAERERKEILELLAKAEGFHEEGDLFCALRIAIQNRGKEQSP